MSGLLAVRRSAVRHRTTPTVPSVTSTSTFSGYPNAKSFAVPLPASVSAGELLLMFAASNVDGSAPTVSGWTIVANWANGTTIAGYLLTRTATGSEGGTTVTLTWATSRVMAATVYAIANSDGVDGAPTMNTGTSQPAVASSLNTTQDGDLVIAAFAGRDPTGTLVWTTPSGWGDVTTIGDINSKTGVVLCDYAQMSAGASGDQSAGMNPSAYWVAAQIAVKPNGG